MCGATLMTEEIDSAKVVRRGEVGEVNEDPIAKYRLEHRERMLRFWVVTVFGFIYIALCIYIITSGNPELHDYKAGAWGFLSALGGGIVVYITGSVNEQRNKPGG